MLTSFTWSKQLDRGFDTERGRGAQLNDSLNYAVNKDLTSTSQPFVIVTSLTYQIPTLPALQKNRLLKEVLGGWTLGGVVSIGSGVPIRVPSSTNNLSQLTFIPEHIRKPCARRSAISAGPELPLLRPEHHRRPQSGSLGGSGRRQLGYRGCLLQRLSLAAGT
jgi:hypothetical protein